MAKPRSPKQRARDAKRTPAEHARPATAAPAPTPPAEPVHVVEPAEAVATPVATPVAAPVAAPVVSAAVPHEDANSAAHGADHHTPSDDHDADHATTGHGHHESELGPFDVVMWTFGMVGVMLGILVWAAFAIATTTI